jgi:hypothetical protein
MSVTAESARLLSHEISGMSYFVIEQVECVVALLSLYVKCAFLMPVKIQALMFLILHNLIRR